MKNKSYVVLHLLLCLTIFSNYVYSMNTSTPEQAGNSTIYAEKDIDTTGSKEGKAKNIKILIFAIKNNKVDLLKALITKKGFSTWTQLINLDPTTGEKAASKPKSTCLHLAAEAGKYDVALLLLQKGTIIKTNTRDQKPAALVTNRSKPLYTLLLHAQDIEDSVFAVKGDAALFDFSKISKKLKNVPLPIASDLISIVYRINHKSFIYKAKIAGSEYCTLLEIALYELERSQNQDATLSFIKNLLAYDPSSQTIKTALDCIAKQKEKYKGKTDLHSCTVLTNIELAKDLLTSYQQSQSLYPMSPKVLVGGAAITAVAIGIALVYRKKIKAWWQKKFGTKQELYQNDTSTESLPAEQTVPIAEET